MNIFNFFNDDKKRVKFNKIISTALIPTKDEIIDQTDFDQLWYRPEEYKIMKKLFNLELQVIAYQQNITLRDSLILWKYNSTMKEDMTTTEQY
jgi:hypothetical protein